MTDEPELKYFADLIDKQAVDLGDKPYILFDARKISFARYNDATCSAANGLALYGAKPGDGVAIFMGNCPEYLFIFYGMPRGGFYSVPVNVALKGDGLKFILTNSDAKFLFVDDTLYPRVADLGDKVGAIEKIFVRRTTSDPLPKGAIDLDTFLDASSAKPDYVMEFDVITSLMSSSATTGFPA